MEQTEPRPAGPCVFDITLFVGATAVTRFVCRSHYLYDLDSVNFALALGRFDPAVHQPHPPGYLLYILLGKVVLAAVPDANSAFVAIGICASCGAAAAIYFLARDWFGAAAARFAALLFVVSPLAWFHGTVALTYIVEMFFSAVTGYLCWKRSVRAGAAVLGLAAGFRPTSLLFLGPLFIYSLRGVGRRKQLAALAILSLSVLAWLVPMVWLGGGLRACWTSLAALWHIAPGRATVFNSTLANSLARFLTICAIYALCFGSAALLPFSGRLRRHTMHGNPPDLKAFSVVWIGPGILFFTFVFLRFVNSGYLLVLAPPAFAWLGLCASLWWKESGAAEKRVLACAAIAVNVAIFLFAPLYCSYSAILGFEREISAVLASLPAVASPRDTLIVGFDSHFMGYRHAGYYLPDYLTVEYPKVPDGSGAGVSTMRHRDTSIARGLPDGTLSRFVLFPLPTGERAYELYTEAIESKFTATGLRRITSGGHVFVTGPIEDLNVLFPPETALKGTASKGGR